MKPQMPQPSMQEQAMQEQAMKQQIADSIQASDARFHPALSNKRVTAGLLGGFIRGALVFGAIAALVATGFAAVGILGTGATGLAGIQAAGSVIGWITAGIAGVAGLTLGTRNAARESGAAQAYGQARYISQMETGLVVSEVAQQFGKMHEQEMAKCKAQQKPQKPAMDFSHLPGHPAHQPPTERTERGHHTRSVMTQPATDIALGQSGKA